MENNYYTLKLEINRANIEEKSFTYLATGIYKTQGDDDMENPETETFQQSATEVNLIFITMIHLTNKYIFLTIYNRLQHHSTTSMIYHS